MDSVSPTHLSASSSERHPRPLTNLDVQPPGTKLEDGRVPSLSDTNPINGALPSASEPSLHLEPKIQILRPLPIKHTKATTDAAVREAKAEIRSKLREDWEFPVPEGVPLHLRDNEEGTRWVERESDDEVEIAVNAHPAAEAVGVSAKTWHNPDPFAVHPVPWPIAPIQNPHHARKRKRRDLLIEESEINEGLKHFIQQRDAWTGARARHTVPQHLAPPTSPPPPPLSVSALIPHPVANIEAGCSPSPSSTSARTSVTTDTTLTSFTSPASSISAPSGKPSISSLQTPFIIPGPSAHTDPPSYNGNDTLIPHPSPLLPPTNPVRASITPSTYPSLYTKIAIQGMTPTIPVNLADMTAALVRGWKKDGEWPPPPETRGDSRGMVGAGRRKMGFGHAQPHYERMGEGYRMGSLHGGSGHSVSEGGRKAVRRSMGRVKRVLGLAEEGRDGGEGEVEVMHDGNGGDGVRLQRQAVEAVEREERCLGEAIERQIL